MSEEDDDKMVRESWTGGISFSVLLHSAFFIALLFTGFTFYHKKPDPPPPVQMVFDDGQAKTTAVKSKVVKNTPEPPSEKDIPKPHSPVPPTEKPPEPPPPSTPPPPPTPSAPEAKEHPAEQNKAQPSPEPSELAASQSVRKKQVTQPSAVKGPENKTEKPPLKTKPSETKQEKTASKTASDSHSLLASIENFRSEEKQKKPPKAHPNPAPGGTKSGGGNPEGDTRALTSGEQKAMGASVRRCYEQDTASRNYDTFQAHMTITTDAQGIVRLAEFTPETESRMAEDPTYRSFAERARDAVLSPSCSKLPLPARMLGQERVFKFVFRP